MFELKRQVAGQIRTFFGVVFFFCLLTSLFSTSAISQTTTPPPPPATEEPSTQAPIDPKDPKVQDEFKKLQEENPAIAAEIQRLIQMGDIGKATAVYKKYKEEKAAKAKEKLLSEEEEDEARETPLGGKKVKTEEELTPEELKEKKRQKMSELEKILSGEIPQEVSLELAQFGYDIFLRTVSTFAPVDSLPVGPDYVIGPEDEFTLTLWGMVEGIYKLKVSREGTVTLPKVGVTPVAGVRFGDLEQHIKQKLSRYYRDFNLSLSMGNLRTMQIYVVGEVNHPGSYSLGSLSTAFNALFAAGGPTKKGSLRNIRVLRGGKAVKTIDLYLFLMKGDKTQDLRLQPEDTILVPLIGPVVGVAGNVYRPAIYETKGETTLKDALALAGGALPTGFLSQVQVERIESNQKKVVADLDLRQDGPDKKQEGKENGLWAMSIRNMDLIKVLPISDRTENIVYLTGHVKRPGGYELKAEMRLLDLFPKGYEDLLPDSYLEYGEITRVKEPDLHPETIPFHVGKLLSGDVSQNVSLLRFDRVTLFSKEQIREVPSVEVTGSVQRPGIFPYLEGMRVKDLIFKAGNLQGRAFQEDAELVRTVREADRVRVDRLHVNLKEVLLENPEQNILLQPDDHLFIRETPDWIRQTVSILGEVPFPGIYTISKGERLSSVIRRAGGFTSDADPQGAIFTRQSVRERQEKHYNEFLARTQTTVLRQATTEVTGALSPEEISIQQQALVTNREMLELLREGLKSFEGRVVIPLDDPERLEGTLNDIQLMDGDSLAIPKRSQSVNVLGEVYNQGAVLYQQGKTVGDYLAQVGGPTREADRKSIYLLRSDGTVMSQAQMGYFKNVTDLSVNPGDSIMVPPKVVRPSFWRDTKDIIQILFQIAVTAATVKVLF